MTTWGTPTYPIGGITTWGTPVYPSIAPPAGWYTFTNSPNGKNRSSAFKIGSKIYCVCGVSSSKNDEYNMLTDTWTNKADHPAGSTFPSYGSNGILGFIGRDNQIDFYAYNPIENTWGAKANATATSYDVCGNIGSSLYCKQSSTATLATYAYDMTGNSWSSSIAPPSATTQSASAVWNNILYTFGGNKSAGTTKECNSFNGSSWTSIADMATTKYGCSAGSADGKIIVVGGYVSGTTTTLTSYMYHTSTNTWSSIDDALYAHANAPTTSYYSGSYFFVIGGVSGQTTRIDGYSKG